MEEILAQCKTIVAYHEVWVIGMAILREAEDKYEGQPIQPRQMTMTFINELPLIIAQKNAAKENPKNMERTEYFLNCLKKATRCGGAIDSNDIIRAKEFPIENLIESEIKENKCPCPLHDEKTASFHIYKTNNSWYCYGCGKGGDVIALHRLINNVEFIESVNFLSKNI